MERTVEIVEKENELALEESSNRFNNAPTEPMMNFQELEDYMGPVNEKVSILSREFRMLLVPEFDELPKYGNVMSLESFIENCNDGRFTNYDGFGNYVKDGKESNIKIYPSDVRYGTIRSDFDTIIWFNR